MPFACIAALSDHLAAETGAEELSLHAERCPPEMDGDITVNCFRLARPCKRKPEAVAELAAAFLRGHEDVAAVTVIKAFVNVALQSPALFRDCVADGQALLQTALPAAQRSRWLVEFSAPNTNKPQHLGHVRNNALGRSTCNLLRRAGHTVAAVNLVNDRGIHICKSMLAYQRFGDGLDPAGAGKKGDHLVGDFYVQYDLAFKRQVEGLRERQPELADNKPEELFLQTEIGRAAQDMLQAWEAGDLAVRALWQMMNGWVLDGFQQTYRRMGVHFDHTYYESETYRAGKETIRRGLQEGVFQQREDGAVVIDLGKKLGGEKVVLRSDGTSVYVTQDIGTTLLKADDHRPQQMVWVVGDEQKHHFKVLFAILERLGYRFDCHHMAYGMVNLPTGKMKSREGTVVDADDLFAEMAGLARAEVLQRVEEAGGEPPADLESRAEAIGLGAIVFMLLKVNPKTTMTFNPEESVKFEGDTGPYVQYACARIHSIEAKAATADLPEAPDWALLGEPEERVVALQCADYPATVQRAAAELDPSILATYLLELAKAVSRFYNKHHVLRAATPALGRTRLELCRRARAILRDGLEALGVTVLESM